MNILYSLCIDRGQYYLSSLNPATATLTQYQYNRSDNLIFFKKGHDVLFNYAPTWFNSHAEAVAAAEEQGFIVLGEPTPYSALRR